MEAADEVGPLERACICAGWRSIDSANWDRPQMFLAAEQPPTLMVPEEWIRRGWRDAAFGEGMAELFLKRHGWLALVRVLVHLDEAAAFFEQQASRQTAAD